MLTLLLGFAFGFIGSIPVAGPISLLVVAYSLQARYRDALALAAGGALAEGAYAALAFRGMSVLLARYPQALPWSRAAGALVLLGLGVAFARGTMTSDRPPPASQGKSFFVGFGLTALNPTLLVTWTAATTTLYGTGLLRPDQATVAPFAGGAAAGIVAWFAVLILLLRRHHGRLQPATIARIVRGVGILLIALGLWFAWGFARDAYLRPAGSRSTATPATTSSIDPSVRAPSVSLASAAPSSTAMAGFTYA